MKNGPAHFTDSLYDILAELEAYAGAHPDQELDHLLAHLHGAIAAQAVITVGMVNKKQKDVAKHARRKDLTREMIEEYRTDFQRKYGKLHGWKTRACLDLNTTNKTIDAKLRISRG